MSAQLVEFTSLDEWKAAAKKAQAKVKVVAKWYPGGCQYVADHPDVGTIGFYKKGVHLGVSHNSGALQVNMTPVAVPVYLLSDLTEAVKQGPRSMAFEMAALAIVEWYEGRK